MEVMIALVIFSIAGAATFAILQRAIAARLMARRMEAELFAAARAVGQLRDDLARSAPGCVQCTGRPVPAASIRGSADSLYLHSALVSPGDSLAERNLIYYVTSSGIPPTLTLYRSADTSDGTAGRSMLTGIDLWQLSYLQLTAGGAHWIESWRGQTGMPAAVRLLLRLASWDEPREFYFTIHTGRRLESGLETSEPQHDE